MSSFDPGVLLYLRLRGKVSGPFTRAQLIRLREQGGLTAFHEVSVDGVRWQLASDAGLVPSPTASRTDLQLTVDVAREQPTVPESLHRWFYLDAAGAQQGPYTPEQITELARRGSVRVTTLVWCEGQAGWQPAAETGLADLLTSATGSTGARRGNRVVVNPAGLIAGLLLLLLGVGCFALAWVEETRLAEIDFEAEKRLAPRPPDGLTGRPGEVDRTTPKESRAVVYLLVGAGVFLGGTGISVLLLGTFRRPGGG